MTKHATQDDSWTTTRCYATALRRADRAINRIYDDALRPFGLTTQQYSLLSLISRAPEDVTASRLADAQAMDRTTMSRNLEQLAAAGFVTFTPAEDRRKRLINLTPSGTEMLATARPHWRAVQDRIESEQGLQHLTELISELESLSESAKAAGTRT